MIFCFQDADRFCPTSFDSILCWPRTPKGSLATLPCLAELSGVHYDISSMCVYIIMQQFVLQCHNFILYKWFMTQTSVIIYFEIENHYYCHTTIIWNCLHSTENASRFCHLDGNWDNYTNYVSKFWNPHVYHFIEHRTLFILVISLYLRICVNTYQNRQPYLNSSQILNCQQLFTT